MWDDMKNMDKSNKKSLLFPEDAEPHVIYANYISVPPGREWPAHNIADLELVLVLNGVFTAMDRDHVLTELKAGDVLLIRPLTPCDLLHRSYGNPSMISCIHFELRRGRKLVDGGYSIAPEAPWVVRTGGDLSLIELFRRCASEFAGFGKYREEMLSAIFKQIWLMLMRRNSSSESAFVGGRFDSMLEFIKRNANRPITRADLAEEFHLTPQYVNFLFKRELGMSPGDVIMREKMRRAAESLSKGRRNVSETAYDLGFSDPLYFSRSFRKIMGAPPSKFRR